MSGIAERFAALANSRRLPAVEILTKRLRLRPYADTDIDAHVAVFAADPARACTRAHASTWCTRTAHEIRTRGDGICWAAEERSTGRVIGLTGLHRTDWADRVTDVSASLAPTAAGRGYATEGLRAITHWVLTDQGFRRVRITAAADNRPSRLVAASCGFIREGTGEDMTDLVVYELTSRDLAGLAPVSYAVRQAEEQR